MKRNVSYLVILLLISLSIGFAALTTSLFFNGEVTLLANVDDFDVVFTNSETSDNSFSYISPEGTTLTFATKKLVDVGDEAVLHYTVTNNSREFDANVDLSMSDENGNSLNSEYVSIENTVPLKSNIDAKESSDGVLTVKLLKPSDKDMTLNFKLTIDASSVERDTIAEDKIDKFSFDGLAPGLYDENNVLIASWTDLVNDYGLDISSDTKIDLPDKQPEGFGYVFDKNKISTVDSYLSIMSFMVSTFGRVASEHAFSSVVANHEELQAGRTLVISSDVNKIGAYSLALSSKLVNVYVPSSVTEIGEGAFTACKNLVNLQLDSKITTIPESMLMLDSKIDDFVVPEGVTNIEDGAFVSSRINKLYLPSTLGELPSDFFNNPSFITYIDVNANNSHYTSDDGVLYDKDETSLVYYPSGKKDSSYSFPASIKHVKKYSIFYNSHLKHAIFNGMLDLEEYAIMNNTKLEDITFNSYIIDYPPKSITYNPSLKNIFASADNELYHDIDGVLYGKNNLVYYPDGRTDESYTPDSNTTTISSYAFSHAMYLKNLEFNEGLNSIQERAINNSNIEKIYIPSSVNLIQYRNFEDCEKLKNIIISPDNKKYKSVDGVPYTIDSKQLIFYPSGRTDEEYTVLDGVTSLTLDGWNGTSVFYENQYLKTINLPSSIAKISGYDYRQLINLENINISDDNPNYCSVDGIVYSKDKTELVTYPGGRSSSEFVVPSHVTKIGMYAFDSNEKLYNIILPNGLITIEKYSFEFIRNLDHITIPASVTAINRNAFFIASNITNVIFENPNGWQCNGEQLDATELSDPAKAAEYLVHSKDGYDWNRL